MPLTKAQTTTLKLAADNNGYFDPAASTLKGGALNKVTTALIKKDLLEPETNQGFPITQLGFEAIGKTSTSQPPIAPREGSKTAKLIHMLQRTKGATSKDIQNRLGWQAHSVRGVISTLKSKNHYDISKIVLKNGDMAYIITH